jgi:ATPase subunit of ABC transporter with duplicated ATPase domains
MVVLEHNGSWVHPGNYRTFREARRDRIERLTHDLSLWEREERRLHRDFRRWKERAKSSEAAAQRMRVAEARWIRYCEVGPPELPPPEREINPQFRGSRAGREAIRIENFEVPDLILPFDLKVFHGDRIALLGENGVGKSTLFKMLMRDSLPEGASVRYGPNAIVGYFSQENTLPDEDGTLHDILAREYPNDQAIRSTLGRYGLGRHSRHRYTELSGGQKARVQLMFLERREPNLLFLDEPTDNLDLESIEVIERVLRDLNATQIAITHDREFTRVFERWVIFDKDGLVGEVLDRDKAVSIVSGRRFSLMDVEGVKILTRY